MKPSHLAIIATLALTILSGMLANAAPMSTAFTYQGQLIQNGNPVNSTADFQFTLWDALGAGTQVAGPAAVNNVTVTSGQFAVSIDFGSTVFSGDARWLQIAVRSPAGSGTFTTLSPRQPLTAVPYALQTRGMFVNSAGNLGIGTTSPLAKLHIANGDFVAGAPGQEWYFHSRSSFGGDFLHITDNDAGVPQFQRGFVIHQNGNVGIGTTAPASKLDIAAQDGIRINGFEPFLTLRDTNSNLQSRIQSAGGFLRLFPPSGGVVASFGEHYFYNASLANVAAINPDPPVGNPTFPLGTPTMSAGSISLFGPAGRTRFGVWSRRTTPTTWYPNQAELFMEAADGTKVISIYCAGEGGAQGSSGNIVCTNFLATGSKNFIVPNPDNAEEDITYACMEGPECGIYMRGTARLSAGQSHVSLPSTFSSLASQEGLTVILTPLSGDSRGLACVNRSINGFDVVELMQGNGTYEFDWEVKAIRRGTRDYQVVHPWTEHAGGDKPANELWELRMADIERRNAKFAQEDAELGPRPGVRTASATAAE
jgi:hypothetical protein